MAGTVGSVLPLWQAQHHFGQQLEAAEELLHTQLAYEQGLHDEAQEVQAALHGRTLRLQRELHCEEVSHAVAIARREAVRDAWARKNQRLQSLMIVDTLMFGCAAGVLVEAELPVSVLDGATDGASLVAAKVTFFVRLQALALSVALCTLLLSIWAAVKLQARLARFDMHRPKLVYACGGTHRTFTEYFECHGRWLQSLAFAAFYVGTACTVAAAANFLAAHMWMVLESPIGGAASAVIGALTAVAIAGAGIGRIVRRYFERRWEAQRRVAPHDGSDDDRELSVSPAPQRIVATPPPLPSSPLPSHPDVATPPPRSQGSGRVSYEYSLAASPESGDGSPPPPG